MTRTQSLTIDSIYAYPHKRILNSEITLLHQIHKAATLTLNKIFYVGKVYTIHLLHEKNINHCDNSHIDILRNTQTTLHRNSSR